MTQGQYGIGLLGFWSLGERLEMRSSVPGPAADAPGAAPRRAQYEIEPLRGRLLLDERWTEILVLGMHPSAQSILPGRRAADYLAAELRGQLLARDVNLVYEDHMSRGTAQKVITIRPRRFLGEKLAGFDAVEVPGHAPVRLELHLRGAPPPTARTTATTPSPSTPPARSWLRGSPNSPPSASTTFPGPTPPHGYGRLFRLHRRPRLAPRRGQRPRRRGLRARPGHPRARPRRHAGRDRPPPRRGTRPYPDPRPAARLPRPAAVAAAIQNAAGGGSSGRARARRRAPDYASRRRRPGRR